MILLLWYVHTYHTLGAFLNLLGDFPSDPVESLLRLLPSVVKVRNINYVVKISGYYC